MRCKTQFGGNLNKTNFGHFFALFCPEICATEEPTYTHFELANHQLRFGNQAICFQKVFLVASWLFQG